MKAFIIGNGFDLAHDMPTSYNYFKKYLIKRFPCIENKSCYVPSQIIAPDGENIVDQNEAAPFLYHIINNVCGKDWSDFETALGNIDLFGCFDILQETYDLLRKDTDGVIEKHYDELLPVSLCQQIYSFGLSYSHVDKPYINHICGLLKGHSVEWFFTSHDARNKKRIAKYKKAITSCGFMGSFSVY